MITMSQILFSAPYSINKDYVWLQTQKNYNFNLMFVTTLFHFLICGFHCCYFLSNFIFDLFLAWIIFPDSLSFLPNPSNFTMVFDYAITNSNMFKFIHYYSCVLCNIATFHVTRRFDFTIMVFECSQPFPNVRHG